MTSERVHYYDATTSTCPQCKKIVQARTIGRDGKIYLQTHCQEHGISEALVYSDEQFYLDAQAFCKPGTYQRVYNSKVKDGCPNDCGFCPDHEQHICMPIVEITDHCDMQCPVCLVQNKESYYMEIDALKEIVERLILSEGQVQVLSLSGGEPTCHPQYKEMLEYLVSVPEILRVSVSTNGLRLARDKELRDLHKKLDVVVSLQFDGFKEETYEKIRGNGSYAAIKKNILEIIKDEDMAASLTVTAVRGINEDEFPAIVKYFLQEDNLLSMTIQPFSHEGTGSSFVHDPKDRVTIPEVIDLIAKGSDGVVQRDDFTPLPCSHPTCFCLTFLLKVEGGGWLPIKRVLAVDDYLDLIRNRSYISADDENVDKMKGLLYELWSGPAMRLPQSDGALKTMKNILKQIDASGGEEKDNIRIAERKMKSIFIHQFMDTHTFDVSRVRRCCTVYPKEDGKIYPMCAYNVLHRGKEGKR